MKNSTLKAPATLDGLRRVPCDPLILAVRDDGQPLKGLTGLVDWRTGGLISALIKEGAFHHDHPVLHPRPAFISCGRLLMWRLGAFTPGDMVRVIRDLKAMRPGICARDFEFSEPEIRQALGPEAVFYGD